MINRRQRTRSLLATAVLMGGLVVALDAGPAQANGQCSVSAGIGHAGYASNGLTTDYGSQAQIVTRDALLCYGSNNSKSGGQVTLTSSSKAQYVSAGYEKVAGTPGYSYFVRSCIGSSLCGTSETLWTGSYPALGSTHTYTVQYQASYSREVAGFDLTGVAYAYPNYGSSDWSAGRRHYYGADADVGGTDAPGTSASPMTVQQLKVQQAYHNCCDAVSQNLSVDLNIADASVTGIAFNAFNVWSNF